MIIVTGGAGFIGSNIVQALNEQGREDILVVDDLSDSSKFINLSDLKTIDYVDRLHFQDQLSDYRVLSGVEAVFHQGACSDTMATDGREMMETNFSFSKKLLDRCLDAGTSIIYASSAAIYGPDKNFVVGETNEFPLNIYAYSKYLFDRLVSSRLSTCSSQVVGLRYFNVYGPREKHKGRMASVVYQMFEQFEDTGEIRLFEGTSGFNHGEQRRDFVSVKDVVSVNLHMFQNTKIRGIANVGSGKSRSFNDVALLVINTWREIRGMSALSLEAAQKKGVITYFPMPEELEDKYQNFTEANLDSLRDLGFDREMIAAENGVGEYVRYLFDNK